MRSVHTVLAILVLIVTLVLTVQNRDSQIPREKPTLTCELVLVPNVTASLSHIADVTITNRTNEPIDIEWMTNRLEHLDIKIKNTMNAEVKVEPYSSHFSISQLEPRHLIIYPNESYTERIPVLVVMPRESYRTGVYKVKAIYTYKDKTYESNQIQVPVFVK